MGSGRMPVQMLPFILQYCSICSLFFQFQITPLFLLSLTRGLPKAQVLLPVLYPLTLITEHRCILASVNWSS